MPPRKKIVPISRTISLHRTFDEEKKGDPIFYVAEAGKAKKYTGLKLNPFLESIEGDVTIRVTSLAYFLPILQTMANQGARVVSAHWHNTGLEKGLAPEDIALGFLSIPEDVLFNVQLRQDLHNLRQLVNARQAVVKYRKAAFQTMQATSRSMGFADDLATELKPVWLRLQEEDVIRIEKMNETPIEKDIAKHAAKIPECILLNQILGVNGSWGTAASVIAYLGDPARFPSVAALWHYSGQHVVDGKAPKRKKGMTSTWNSNVRTALWNWADSMLKTRNPIWRPIYDQYLAEELAVHLDKHPGCIAVQGHSGARARRRVVKDVLKEFLVKANNLEQYQAA
jgi:hypothetical protein